MFYEGYINLVMIRQKEKKKGHKEEKNQQERPVKMKIQTRSYQVRRPTINSHLTRLIHLSIDVANPDSSFFTRFLFLLR